MLFGKYCLLERISVGGMAEVFRAKPFDVPDFRGFLALKRILPHLAEDDEFIKMFVDEAKVTVALDHPNIVKIYELGQFQSSYYILMEFISGKDVLALQKKMRKLREVIPLELSLHIARDMAKGLHYAHHARDADGNPLNIIHRDVSPQNVLIDYRGRVRVIDFGVAKAAVQSTRTQIGVLKGKMGYMSPEQVKAEPLDYRADVFAIGTVLWEMLTNRRLFHADNEYETMRRVREVDVLAPSSRNGSIPPEVDDIVMGALTLDPEARYPTAGHMAEVIGDYLRTLDYDDEELSFWMRTVFAEDLEEERDKREEFAEIRSPDDVRRIANASYATDVDPGETTETSEATGEGGHTEIWDVDVAPTDGQNIMEFVNQHTVVAAGGFSAADVTVDDVDTNESLGLDRSVGDTDERPARGVPGIDTTDIDDMDTPVTGSPVASLDEWNREAEESPPAETVEEWKPEFGNSAQTSPPPDPEGDFNAPATNPNVVAAPARIPGIIKVTAALSALVFVVGVAAVFYVLTSEKPPPAVTTGTVVVNVTPPTELEIRFDDELVASSAPHKLEGVEPGRHVVDVRREGSEPYRAKIDVTAGGLLPLEVTLEEIPNPEGVLVLSLPTGDEVALWVDGTLQPQPDGPATLTLPVGKHLVEVLQPGFRPWTEIVEIANDVRKERAVTLRPLAGPLRFAVDERATVRFDGKTLGRGAQVVEEFDPLDVHRLQVALRDQGLSEWGGYLGYPDLARDTFTVDFDEPLPPQYRKSDFGALRVSTGADWWSIEIDGVPTGFVTPILPRQELPVPKGPHTVTLRRGETTHDFEVEIVRGETLVLEEQLPFGWNVDG